MNSRSEFLKIAREGIKALDEIESSMGDLREDNALEVVSTLKDRFVAARSKIKIGITGLEPSLGTVLYRENEICSSYPIYPELVTQFPALTGVSPAAEKVLSILCDIIKTPEQQFKIRDIIPLANMSEKLTHDGRTELVRRGILHKLEGSSAYCLSDLGHQIRVELLSASASSDVEQRFDA